jgi:SNF2 family DNA or RNA helicase
MRSSLITTKALKRLRGRRRRAVEAPKLIRTTEGTHFLAWLHQVPAIRHLIQTSANGLFMDPGTGKTTCVLAAFHILRKKNLVHRLVVLAPLIPCYEVWPVEVEHWGFPFDVVVLHGPKKNERIKQKADIYVINYDGLPWLYDNFEKLIPRDSKEVWWLVGDESTKIKHTNTRRFKMLKPMLPAFSRRTILTGTPAPNGYMDLFGQVYAVDYGERLGRYITQYRREYFYPTGYGGYSWVLQEDGEKRIQEKLDGAFFRVSDAVLKLPKRHDVPLFISLPDDARKVYERLEAEFIAELGSGVVTAVNAGVLSSKLRQVANGQLYDGDHKSHEIHDQKITAVCDLVEQLQGNPLLVGYEFTADGERVARALGDAPMISGNTKPREVKALFGLFNEGKLPALIAQTGKVSLGSNLQKACHTVALFGLTWDLEVYIQFAKRVHRGGQKKTVIVHHILARNTIDELMWKIVKMKDRRQSNLLNTIKKRYLK